MISQTIPIQTRENDLSIKYLLCELSTPRKKAASEDELNCHLNLTRRGSVAVDAAKSGTRSARRTGKDRDVWIAVIGTVENVEKLGPDFEMPALSHPEVFNKREIAGDDPRPDDRVSRRLENRGRHPDRRPRRRGDRDGVR